MQIKILIVAIIKNENSILLRKKPDGSPPYKETWYIFGADLIPGQDIELTLQNHIRQQTGVEVRLNHQLSWDSEIKKDIDGVTKQFIYLDTICNYTSGDLRASPGIEKLEWVSISDLANYDNVPPSVKLFKKIGYIKQ